MKPQPSSQISLNLLNNQLIKNKGHLILSYTNLITTPSSTSTTTHLENSLGKRQGNRHENSQFGMKIEPPYKYNDYNLI